MRRNTLPALSAILPSLVSAIWAGLGLVVSTEKNGNLKI
jgi:hypothetical protein